MKFSRSFFLILAAWVFFIGVYVAAGELLPRGPRLTAFVDVFECLVPLFANACLLWNAATPYRRRNAFWMLLAMGCTLWLAGHLVLTYQEVELHHEMVSPFPGDLLFFLHTVPFMAALALVPHARKMRETFRYGFLDLLILAVLWLYVYVFAAMPWKTVWFSAELFRLRDFEIYAIENLIVVIGFAFFFVRTRGSWRVIYGHMFGATALYLAGFAIGSRALSISQNAVYSGSLYDIPILAAFLWMATAGIIARGLPLEPEPPPELPHRDTQWPLRWAMTGVLALPFLAGWTVFASDSPAVVRQYRLFVTLVAMVIGASLVFLRQHLVYQERTSLVRELYASLENVKRLQSHFVQSEKLASLGQLAAGAAHEINNPLTAILGYADVLIVEHEPNTRARTVGEKIRDQARRTKELVTNLLSFARQVPAEKQLLDLNAILSGAVQLRNLDLREKNIRIDLETHSVLPAVRGDPNQLLQVFYHLISNAVDAMEASGNGVLQIRTFREKGDVVLEFSDTGCGLREPDRVFDPFYTTKPVGKGTGLGLSICYGIVQEHGGRISGFNKSSGGCTFRLEFPGVLAMFPQAASSPVAPVNSR